MIGVFDSGVGGLFALRALRACLPRADLLYVADTRNLPYGGREAWELLALARRAIIRLRDGGACMALAACGTVSSTVLPQLRRELSIPLYGILEPTADAVCRAWRGGSILVLGTQATVRAGTLRDRIEQHCGGAVKSLACPSFVEMAESGCADRQAIEELLSPYTTQGIDTVVLGCTHFSRLSEEIAAVLPHAVIVDGAREAAWAVAAALPHELTRGSGRCLIGTSGDADTFFRQAAGILGEDMITGRL